MKNYLRVLVESAEDRARKLTAHVEGLRQRHADSLDAHYHNTGEIKQIEDPTRESGSNFHTLGPNKHKAFNELIGHDPSPNKAYSEWLSRTGRNGGIKHEDFADIKDTITKFHNNKHKLPNESERDINQYKSLRAVSSNLSKHGIGVIQRTGEFGDLKHYKTSSPIEKDFKAPDIKKAYDEGYVFHDDKDGRIVFPGSMHSSQVFGHGTQWCTRRLEHDQNQFYNYTNGHEGVENTKTGQMHGHLLYIENHHMNHPQNNKWAIRKVPGHDLEVYNGADEELTQHHGSPEEALKQIKLPKGTEFEKKFHEITGHIMHTGSTTDTLNHYNAQGAFGDGIVNHSDGEVSDEEAQKIHENEKKLHKAK